MTAKILIAILLLGLPVAAEDSVRTSLSDGWVQYGDVIVYEPLDTLWGWERDTTRYYIKEIKQKCDTNHQWTSHDCRRCRPACSALVCVPKIACIDDTVWAEKVQVWLTPEQLERLIKQITPRKPGEPMEWEATW